MERHGDPATVVGRAGRRGRGRPRLRGRGLRPVRRGAATTRSRSALAADGRDPATGSGSPYAVAPGHVLTERRHALQGVHAVLPGVAGPRLGRAGAGARSAPARARRACPAAAGPDARARGRRRPARRRARRAAHRAADAFLDRPVERLRRRPQPPRPRPHAAACRRTSSTAPSTPASSSPGSVAARAPARFATELCWREFYADVLLPPARHGAPRTSTRRWTALTWDTGKQADERFEAWCQGRTGYPIVDAGMRQLLAEGWMHNRVRMIVGQLPGQGPPPRLDAAAPRWFMQHLVDGDLASNNARLAVDRRHRHRRRAVLPGLQPDRAGPAVRPRRRLRPPLGARAARLEGDGRARAVDSAPATCSAASAAGLPGADRRPRGRARRGAGALPAALTPEPARPGAPGQPARAGWHSVGSSANEP